MSAERVRRDTAPRDPIRRRLLLELGLLVPGLDDIRRREPRLAPLVLVFLFSVVSAFSVQPFLSAAAPESSLGGLRAVIWLAAVLSPLLLGARAGVLAVLAWSALTVGGRVQRLRPILSVFLYGEALLAVRGVILVMVLQLRGLDGVGGLRDLRVPMGPAWLVPSTAPVLLATARGATLVHLAWFVFLALALHRSAGLSRRASWLVAGGSWALTLAVDALRAMATG